MGPRFRVIYLASAATLALQLGGSGDVPDACAKGHHTDADWSLPTSPTLGPPRVIGRHGAACIAGAVPLPMVGEGFQAVDVGRRRYYGHPTLIDYVARLGGRVATAGLGTMLVGDMAQPRGGPMAFGHVSHQSGLDVDIWFRMEEGPLPAGARDGLPQPLVVDPGTGRVDPALWTDRQAQLVHLATQDSRVSRVFLGAALKRDLCQRAWKDRTWLRAVRPWPGHDDHLHVRLRCPPDSPECRDLGIPPTDEGCDSAALASALAAERAWRLHRAPTPSRAVPAPCEQILGDAPLGPVEVPVQTAGGG